MFNAYFALTPELPKTIRALLYFTRFLLLLAFTSIFAGTGAEDVSERDGLFVNNEVYKVIVNMLFYDFTLY